MACCSLLSHNETQERPSRVCAMRLRGGVTLVSIISSLVKIEARQAIEKKGKKPSGTVNNARLF